MAVTVEEIQAKEEKGKRKRKPKQLAVVEQAGCTGCEFCIEFCPVDCIIVVPGPEHDEHNKLVEIDLEECVGCTLCAKYCPWDTIYMLPYADAVAVAPDLTLRTVVYQEKPFPKE